MEKRKSKFRKIGGGRPGRNVCISSRITDDHDGLIDEIAENENKTRSEIVSEAIHQYLLKKKTHRRCLYPMNCSPSDIPSNHFSLIIEVEKDEDGILIGSVPSIPGCHTYGETIDELIANIKEAIEANFDWL